jgi:hypothetical protein
MMKSIIALSLLFSLATAIAGKPHDLYISVSMTISVHGTSGGRSTKTTFTVSGNKCVYEETYDGESVGGRQPVHKEYTLTAQEMSNLKRLIKIKNLLRSRSETSPPGNVPYTAYDLTEEVRWQGKRSLIKVSGPKESLNSDGMKNSRLYQDADALLEYIRATVNLKG